MQDILCKSNPWSSVACGRSDCFTCDSSSRGENPNFKSCYQRSIVYETWCNKCLKNHCNMCDDTDEDQVIYDGEWLDRVETELIKMKGTIDEKRKRDANENENVDGSYYRYIGESSRSSYERGGDT